jgi:glutamyl-Q tRNA(Asp) synthetase
MPHRPAFRFAPSPNGELHLGHALSALVTWERARAAGGRFLLRIEDIDQGRCRPRYIARIIEDLAWLGLRWEEPVLRQSEHLTVYRSALARLEAMGVLYPCFATRREIAAALAASRGPRLDPDGAPLYPGLHKGLPPEEVRRRMAAGASYALRLDMTRAAALARELAGGKLAFTELAEDRTAQRIDCEPERWGDVVLARKDVAGSYHLCVVVDDARQGVTHVTRGRDLYAQTDIHRVLQPLLGLPEPLYHHHRLITDASGRKLAKSARDTSLRALREAGVTAADVRRRVGLLA